MNTALTSPHPPFIGWQITLLRPGDGRVYIYLGHAWLCENLYASLPLPLSSYMECLNHTAGQYVICLFIQCSNGTRTTYDFDPIIRLLTLLLRVIRNTVLRSAPMTNIFHQFLEFFNRLVCKFFISVVYLSFRRSMVGDLEPFPRTYVEKMIVLYVVKGCSFSFLLSFEALRFNIFLVFFFFGISLRIITLSSRIFENKLFRYRVSYVYP